jgi:hypothetical protein
MKKDTKDGFKRKFFEDEIKQDTILQDEKLFKIFETL